MQLFVFTTNLGSPLKVAASTLEEAQHKLLSITVNGQSVIEYALLGKETLNNVK